MDHFLLLGSQVHRLPSWLCGTWRRGSADKAVKRVSQCSGAVWWSGQSPSRCPHYYAAVVWRGLSTHTLSDNHCVELFGKAFADGTFVICNRVASRMARGRPSNVKTPSLSWHRMLQVMRLPSTRCVFVRKLSRSATESWLTTSVRKFRWAEILYVPPTDDGSALGPNCSTRSLNCQVQEIKKSSCKWNEKLARRMNATIVLPIVWHGWSKNAVYCGTNNPWRESKGRSSPVWDIMSNSVTRQPIIWQGAGKRRKQSRNEV